MDEKIVKTYIIDEILDANTIDLGKKFRPYSYIVNTLSSLATALTLMVLIGIIGFVLYKGLPFINWKFITTSPSYLNDTYGILPIIINTIYMIVLTLVFALPVGIGGALYLSEYSGQGRIVKIIRSTIEILAGIPSIVYGLFGMILFVTYLNLGYSLLSGSLTLAIMVLPTLIRTTEESLKSVEKSYREGAMSYGVSKFYLIKTILIPCAMPGILAGTILSIGRIVGESAALLFTSSIAFDMPINIASHVMESGATLTVQLFLYATEGNAPQGVPYALASILMIIVFFLNLTATLAAKAMKK